MGMNDELLEFDGDKLYYLKQIPGCGDACYSRHLVMTKEIFIECYKRWIKEDVGTGSENGNDD